MRFLILFFIVLFPVNAIAQVLGEETRLPIPRFVSLRADQIFARTGPGTRYPIKWIYKRKSLPVEIVQEFDTWRKIRDIDGEEAWVHQSLLSGKRFVSINSEAAIPLYSNNSDNSRVIALVESNAILHLNNCKMNWCNVSKAGYEGWISYVLLWGVYEGEQID